MVRSVPLRDLSHGMLVAIHILDDKGSTRKIINGTVDGFPWCNCRGKKIVRGKPTEPILCRNPEHTGNTIDVMTKRGERRTYHEAPNREFQVL